MEINEKRRKLAELVAQERADLERAQSEGRNFDATELENDNRRQDAIAALTQEIQGMERIQERAQRHAAADAARGPSLTTKQDGTDKELSEKRLTIFRRYLSKEITQEQAGVEMRTATHSSGVFTAGGALVTPVEVMNEVLKSADDQTFFNAQNCRVIPVKTADSLGVPVLANRFANAEWTPEVAAGTFSNLTFGGRELTPNLLSKGAAVTFKLLRQVPMIESFIAEQLGYQFGITRDNSGLNGDGKNQPLGILVASDQGISTGRDISLGGSAFTYDKLIDAQTSLKQAYLRNAKWMTNKAHMGSIRKLKDSQNRYLLDINTANTGPIVQLLNSPVLLSEYFPTATTAGIYGMVYGDLKYYWIADATTFTIQVLNELLALQNGIGYVGRLESDGMPVMEEAFARLAFA